jgi:hypothetical protein
MFMISMPKTFKVGDTEDCRINGKPERLLWKDASTLVILPDEAHPIVTMRLDGDLRCFMCGRAGAEATDYVVDADSMFGGGYIVSEKPKENPDE